MHPVLSYARFLSLLTLLTAVVDNGITQEYSFRHLTTAQGLLSDQRIKMTEDKIGRLWIASDEGVNVFDGQELTSYSYPDHSNLMHNNVLQIFCDSRGTVWVAHNRGIQFLPANLHRFRSITLPATFNPEDLLFGETSAGLLVVSRSGCYMIDRDARVYALEWLDEIIKQHGFPLSMEKFSGDQFILGGPKSLLLVDMARKTLTRTYPYGYAWTICPMNDSLVLCGSFGKVETVILNVQSGAMEYINQWGTSDGIPFNGYAGGIRKIGTDNYAMATRYAGVYIIHTGQKFLRHLVSDPDDPASLPQDYCRNLFVTRDGTLFVHSKGISYTSPRPSRFHAVTQLNDLAGTKYNAVVNCFIEDEDQALWIGTNLGLLKWSRGAAAGNFITDHNARTRRPRTMRHLAADDRNRIWVATFGSGLNILEDERRLRQAGALQTGIPSPQLPLDVFAIIPDRQGKFLVCAFNMIAVFDPWLDKLEKLDTHPVLGKVANNRTFFALVDRDLNWWLAQDAGLFFFNRDKNTLTRVELAGEVGSRAIQAVAQDSSGNIYAGGFNGMHILPAGSMKATKSLRKEDGLASDNIMGLLCDKKGDVWIIGNMGLARYEAATGKLQSYDAKDGLLPGNHQLSSYYLSPGGTLYIGNVGGFNYFHPDSLYPGTGKLPVYITQVLARDSMISTMDPGTIQLAWNENNLTFSFLAIDYDLGPHLQFRYQLKGFDTAFVYAGRVRSARYTNLPAGEYQFLAQASANGKDWYAVEQPVTVRISKAFWRTNGFRWGLFGLLALLAYLLYRYRVRKINREARVRADYEIKLNDLENSALRTQMNPHFIFNCLNTINAFINSNDRIQANLYISKFSRLIRLILDHSRQKKILLAEELEALELYIQIERFRFDNKFDYSIEVDENIDPQNTEIPSLMIQPFVENAILHGLLPLKRQGRLRVQVLRRQDQLLCIIEDNGVGRVRASEFSRHQAMKKKSHGMEITLKRIELFNKENGLVARPAITDGINEQGRHEGTRVEIPLAYSESF